MSHSSSGRVGSKITAEEAGDLVLEDEQAYHQGNTDIMLDGPPVHTSKDTLNILTVNLGNFVRGRKKTVPAKFAQHVDHKDYNGVGPLVKSLARSKSHIACALEANNVDIEEVSYLCRHGWYTQSNMGRDIMIMTRTSQAYAYVEHLAGPMREPEVHQYLPLSYWVAEIRYGKSPTAAAIRKTGSNLQDRFARSHMEEDIERCGMPVFRICVFHMSAKVASKKPALMHEAMGVTLADCFQYQVDYITGDANTAGYRTGGSKQGSTSIRDSCFQKMVRYYLKAYNAAQNGVTRHRMGFLTAVLRLSLLRQTRSHCSGGWKTGSASSGRMRARSTGKTFQAWTAWSPAFLSGRIASPWRSDHGSHR